MNVGIIGCGWIAEKHIPLIRSIPKAEIVAIADSDPQRLEEVSKKFKIDNCYDSLKALIESSKIDVLHILTPPFSHKELAITAIREGIHVYIEKPVTLSSDEVEEIYEEAQAKDVKICPGYYYLFEPMFIEAVNQTKEPGFGKVIFVESFYGMNMRRYDRMKTTKDNEIHWSYYLPGGFHQNYISHPLCQLVHFIGYPKGINVVSKSSGALPQGLTDDIRVLFEGEEVNAMMGLSNACEPYQNYLKIIGENQAIKIDWVTMTKTTFKDVKLPKAVTKVFFDNLKEASQLSLSSFRNAYNLVTKKYVPYQGIKELIGKFYHSILWSLPSPLPVDITFSTEDLTGKILKRCSNLHLNFQNRPGQRRDTNQRKTVLVTGASGFVGVAAVKRLLEDGYRVRAFVRKLSYISDLEKLGVEIYFGDIRHYDSFKTAVEGCDVIIHLAAAMKVPAAEFEEITVGGVKNLIKIAEEMNVSKVIYMSSMSVYDIKGCKRRQWLDESHKLERRPRDRGPYTVSKTEAEMLVLKEIPKSKTSWTVLRPSVIFGKGKKLWLNSLGYSFGVKIRIIIGPSDGNLRLIHVDDVVDAIILSLKNDSSNNKIYNLDHQDKITKREYINRYVVPKNGRGINLYVPYPLFYLGALCVEFLFPLLKRKPFITRYRLMASQKDVAFDSSRIRDELGWEPRQSLSDSIIETFLQ
ncbi:MAG: Gfo/Idh/MocA family oxidoreductase [Candidatus Aenigmarchaeota archaeon]|nr:Gfo/Idh/MocA family oxidoreductase [Candidatus Aenigmarchaeota archaeon]